MTRWAACTAASAVVLVGCASAPSRVVPDLTFDVPQTFATAGAEAPTPDLTMPDVWWTTFGDESLDVLIAEGLERNPSLTAAGARLDAALAQARIAGADLWPQVSGSGTASRRKQNFIGLPIPGDPGEVRTSTTTTYGVSLDASWELDLWGRIRKGQSAAVAEAAASQADWMAVRLSLSGQISKAWFTLVEARAQERLASETVASYEATAENIRRSYEQGVRTALDLRLALSDLEAARAGEALRQSQADRTERQLEILVGRYPAAALDEAAELPIVEPLAGSGYPSELLDRRPDVIAVERRAAAAGAQVSAARRALYPRLTLSGSTGTSSSLIDDLLDGDYSVWSLLGGITAPLFQGGRLRANVVAAEAGEDAALAQYVGTILQAFEEAESGLVADRHLETREQSIAASLEHAEAAYRIARDQYNSGLVGVVTLLITQRQLLQRRSDHLAAKRERLTNRVDVHMALGGGIESSPVHAKGSSS